MAWSLLGLNPYSRYYNEPSFDDGVNRLRVWPGKTQSIIASQSINFSLLTQAPFNNNPFDTFKMISTGPIPAMKSTVDHSVARIKYFSPFKMDPL